MIITNWNFQNDEKKYFFGHILCHKKGDRKNQYGKTKSYKW